MSLILFVNTTSVCSINSGSLTNAVLISISSGRTRSNFDAFFFKILYTPLPTVPNPNNAIFIYFNPHLIY